MAKRFSKLTRPAMRALHAKKSISEHGITFHRDASGDGVFSVNVMVDRRRIHRVIGRESDGVTRQQAEDFIAIARTDARRDRMKLPDGRKTPLAFREAAVKYVEKLKEEDGKNIRAKDRQLRQHLVPFFGKRMDMSVQPGLGVRRRVGPDVAGVTVWQIECKEIGFPLDATDHNQGFAEVGLRMARGM